MALTLSEVEAFVASAKAVADRHLSWGRRNEYTRVARLPVEERAIEIGEMLLLINVAHARWWSFALLLRRTAVVHRAGRGGAASGPGH